MRLLFVVLLGSVFIKRTFSHLDGERLTNKNTTLPVTLSSKCGIWFATSTIPNSGVGMFAGRSFHENEPLTASGEQLVPIIDIWKHQGRAWKFLWRSYHWDATVLHMDNEGDTVSVASPGFGSAANSFLDLQNVKMRLVEYSLSSKRRSKDPGAGAFSPYHNRVAVASTEIREGQELFVSYGEDWFLKRTKELGPIPVFGDLEKADALLSSWDRLRKNYENMPGGDSLMKALWETFVWNSPFSEVSREFFALPQTWRETEHVLQSSLYSVKRNQSTRSIEWLRKHGICGDNIREGPSNIIQAGKGAFATRSLPKDTIVAPLPMIHVANRKRFQLYERKSSRNEFNRSKIVGHQLMLNYCFGHRHSTLLLCPYGLLTGLINHSSQHANVKLRWSDPSRSSHHPEWLNRTLVEMLDHMKAVLTMELVALRDITEGEEILLNYGDEWEEAWQKHVQTWAPSEKADHYVSSEALNSDLDAILKTEFDQMVDPYPSNVELVFLLSFLNREDWLPYLRNGTLAQYKQSQSDGLVSCDILRWTKLQNGRVFYTVAYSDEDEDEKHKKVVGVPREAFVFRDRPYTSDLHLEDAFRHDMRIPDELFPEIWMNLLEK